MNLYIVVTRLADATLVYTVRADDEDMVRQVLKVQAPREEVLDIRPLKVPTPINSAYCVTVV